MPVPIRELQNILQREHQNEQNDQNENFNDHFQTPTGDRINFEGGR